MWRVDPLQDFSCGPHVWLWLTGWLWLGGRVVREPDLRSTGRGFGSRPPRCRVQSWASCLHTCASVTKQHNLVPDNWRWCSAAGEVTAGLAESNGSLPPGSWFRSPADWLPYTYTQNIFPLVCGPWRLVSLPAAAVLRGRNPGTER